MNCKEYVKMIYESPLYELDPALEEHLKVCKSCEKEYLKILSLEKAFVNAAKVKEKKRNYWPGFLLAGALSAFFLISPKFIKTEEQIVDDVDVYQIAMIENLNINQLKIENDIYQSTQVIEEYGTFSFEEESFDAYEYALISIENQFEDIISEG